MAPVGEAAGGVDRTAMVTTMYFFAFCVERVVIFVVCCLSWILVRDVCDEGISNYKKWLKLL